MLNAKSRRVASRLRCPECRGGAVLAEHEADGLTCPDCRRAYPVWDGIPALLSAESKAALEKELASETGVSMLREYRAVAEPGAANGRFGRWCYELLRPPGLLYHTNPEMRGEKTRHLYDHRGADTLVLNVGGGPSRYRPSEITMNLEAFHNVDIIGDAHNAPFLDDTFDSIVCNAVLEHVHDAEKVVSEMIRVLKPTGYMYAEVPYMFFFHGYPNDFRRYTREGMKRLFAGLDDAEIGIVIGPVSATLQSLNILLDLLVPRRVPYLRTVVNGCFRWATFPLKYLDIPLMRRDEAHVLAGGFYAVGRKPDAPAGKGTGADS